METFFTLFREEKSHFGAISGGLPVATGAWDGAPARTGAETGAGHRLGWEISPWGIPAFGMSVCAVPNSHKHRRSLTGIGGAARSGSRSDKPKIQSSKSHKLLPAVPSKRLDGVSDHKTCQPSVVFDWGVTAKHPSLAKARARTPAVTRAWASTGARAQAAGAVPKGHCLPIFRGITINSCTKPGGGRPK